MTALSQTIQTICRLFVAGLLILAIICVALGRQVCNLDNSERMFVKSLISKMKPTLDDPNDKCMGYIPMDSWHGRWAGQWFVFIASILMLLLSFGLIGVGVYVRKRLLNIALSAAILFITFICLCVEAWYADYFGKSGYVQSYVAATIFYGVTVILMLADLIISAVNKV